MRISNCKGCGRIFNVLSDEQYCPNCQKKMDEKFDIVKLSLIHISEPTRRS